jgi:hypothetical protein
MHVIVNPSFIDMILTSQATIFSLPPTGGIEVVQSFVNEVRPHVHLNISPPIVGFF